ncbi:MAG TPA: glycosyltransferase [Cytophagaceae bacterium]|jgi:glycosyltransferase involved in cell wall biosynthesis|nr:glycosyltransferase [Cytophagaceae bacterium]
MAKKIIVSVTTDLVTDQRVHKVCSSLDKEGYAIVLVGRQKNDSAPLSNRLYTAQRFRLIFEKGFLFYMEYNIRLFFFLLFSKADILVANDLDTLLPNYLISKLKNIPLVYDNHEYFTGVPELIDRPFVRGVWKGLERFIFPKLKYIYTENESKRKLFEEEYNVPVSVIRNLPMSYTVKPKPVARPEWIGDRKIILYQGAVNKDRGIEEMVEAMLYLDEFVFIIIGKGDVYENVHAKILKLKLQNRVRLIGQLPFESLPQYTSLATLGISIEKDTNISYRYCLPNKIFDYIQAGVPVLTSTLLEMKNVVEKYNVGTFLYSHQAEEIANTVKGIFSNPEKLEEWKKNTVVASAELNWENEESLLLKIYKDIQ